MANSYYIKNEEKLDDIPFGQGNVIYCEFDRSVRVDSDSGERVNYGLVVSVRDDSIRLAIPNPSNALYYVQDTCILWKFDERWVQLTGEASQQIVFAPKEEFPVVGVSKRIYIDELDIYRWKDGRYQLMNKNMPEWGTF